MCTLESKFNQELIIMKQIFDGGKSVLKFSAKTVASAGLLVAAPALIIGKQVYELDKAGLKPRDWSLSDEQVKEILLNYALITDVPALVGVIADKCIFQNISTNKVMQYGFTALTTTASQAFLLFYVPNLKSSILSLEGVVSTIKNGKQCIDNQSKTALFDTIKSGFNTLMNTVKKELDIQPSFMECLKWPYKQLHLKSPAVLLSIALKWIWDSNDVILQ